MATFKWQNKAKTDLEYELSTLVEWFADYDLQVCQYQRCLRLGEQFDKDIQVLDAEAALKQARIREIRSHLELL